MINDETTIAPVKKQEEETAVPLTEHQSTKSTPYWQFEAVGCQPKSQGWLTPQLVGQEL